MYNCINYVSKLNNLKSKLKYNKIYNVLIKYLK